jgi:hypothetical protein
MDNLENLLCDFNVVNGANLVHVLMTRDKRSADYFVTWRLLAH